MEKDASRVEGVRRSWRVRLASGGAAVINGTWGAFNAAVSTANLPADTHDAWEALMSVPELLPFGIAALSLSVLAWSFLPSKRAEAAVDASRAPASSAPPPSRKPYELTDEVEP